MDCKKDDSSIPFEENATCSTCGQFGAYLFDDEKLCAECYEKRGSCCTEFGRDDHWKSAELP